MLPVGLNPESTFVSWTDPQVYLPLITVVISAVLLWLRFIQTRFFKERQIRKRSERLFRVENVPRKIRLKNQKIGFDITMKKSAMVRVFQFDLRHRYEKYSVPNNVVVLEPRQHQFDCRVDKGSRFHQELKVQTEVDWDGYLAVSLLDTAGNAYDQLFRMTVRA